MIILLIRHGMTAGNLTKRYIGKTDEPLCEAGIRQLQSCCFPACDALAASPMRRCVQTAEILFPSQKIVNCKAFRECDFGDFEGKNYAELNGDPQYQSWIDSGGEAPFPNGESPAGFRKRCCAGFLQITAQFAWADSAALVVHGGTIMSILSYFSQPRSSYYDWMTDNAHGWLCRFDKQILTVEEKL